MRDADVSWYRAYFEDLSGKCWISCRSRGCYLSICVYLSVEAPFFGYPGYCVRRLAELSLDVCVWQTV